MRKPILSLTLIMLITLGALLQPGQAEAKRWAKGSTRYFSNDRACRDGMIVSVALFDPANAFSEDSIVIPVGARLYTNTALPLPDSDFFPNPVAYYGPLLIESTPITATRKTTPLEADTNDDGSNDTTFFVYEEGVEVPWSQVVPVSSTVLFFGSNGVLATEVEDCLLNRPGVVSGGSVTLGPNYLRLPESFTDAEAAVYRITGLPALGSLRLDGSPLAVDSSFTQDDVNDGRLSYSYTGTVSGTVSFSYTLSALTMASVNTGGAQGNNPSRNASLAFDGDVVAFQSTANNLVAGDSNNVTDVFYHDQNGNQTLRASVRFDGSQGQSGAGSTNPAISPDGSRVAYQSNANNLTAGVGTCEDGPDTNSGSDIFVSYLNNGVFTDTDRLSISSQRFGTCAGGNGDSITPAIDDQGGVVFASLASNLVKFNTAPITETNADQDVYYRSLVFGGTTSRLSSDPTGNEIDLSGNSPLLGANPTLAADAESDWAAFDSAAATLVAGDVNGYRDVFVVDSNGFDPAIRVSVNSNGVAGTGGPAPNVSGSGSTNPSLSADGRFVAFQSTNTNLDIAISDNQNFLDIFVHDRDADNDGIFDEPGAISTRLISRSAGGQRGNEDSANPMIAPNGHYVTFESDATNLVSGDSNGKTDVFVYDLLSNQIVRASLSATGAQGTGSGAAGGSFRPSISADGQYIAFDSSADNLVAGDTNAVGDVFVRYQGFSSGFPISVTGSTTPPPAPDTLGYLPVVMK